MVLALKPIFFGGIAEPMSHPDIIKMVKIVKLKYQILFPMLKKCKKKCYILDLCLSWDIENI